jgi:hypothetical protein
MCTLVFARPVFKAMTADVLRTTITDMLTVIKTAAKVKCRRRCQRRLSLDRRHRLQL